jgi:hypothetical protein
MYLPVLAIRIQGEARSHGPAVGLKVHTSTCCTPRAQVRLHVPCTARMM